MHMTTQTQNKMGFLVMFLVCIYKIFKTIRNNCILLRKFFLFWDIMDTVFPSRAFKWTLKQKSHRHICRTIPLLVISQLLPRCRFPSKHYQMYILGLWQGAKLYFCSCPASWQKFKLPWERNGNGILAILTTTHMMNWCSGQQTRM